MIVVRKKPVEVEAHRWFKNGDHPKDESEMIQGTDGQSFLSEGKVVRYFRRPDVKGTTICKHCGDTMHLHGWIDTLEGGHIVCPGDWIITGVHGEYYPCKPDIFEKTYEMVDNPKNDMRKGCPLCETPHYGHFHCGTCGFTGTTTIDSINHPCLKGDERQLVDAIMCMHANEVPNKCECPKICYCKEHTCCIKCKGTGFIMIMGVREFCPNCNKEHEQR